MTRIDIQKFGTKLLANTKGENLTPSHYLKVARNVRINGGIVPRPGNSQINDSDIGTGSKGSFIIGDDLYQVANSSIYLVNKTTGSKTYKTSLLHDKKVDVAVNIYEKGLFEIMGTLTNSYDHGSDLVGRLEYDQINKKILHKSADGSATYGYTSISVDNTGNNYPAIKIWYTGTTNSQDSGTGFDDDYGYILEDGQYMELSTPISSGDIKYDSGYYDIAKQAILVAEGEQLGVFDGVSMLYPNTVPKYNTGIIEYCRGYMFLSVGSILYISAPIVPNDTTTSYDFTGVNSQTLGFDKKIVGLKSTIGGLYIFTEDQVHYIGAQNTTVVSDEFVFVPYPLGNTSGPINNDCITASGDRIFYITTTKNVETINYGGLSSGGVIGSISDLPIVGIKETLDSIDDEQPNSFAYNNENERTIQFHVRTEGETNNDLIIVYDLVNETWVTDTGKSYRSVEKIGNKYYAFSDTDTSVFIDGTGLSDSGNAIPTYIKWSHIISNSQSIFNGFYIKGGIGSNTEITVNVSVDGEDVFSADIPGSDTVYSISKSAKNGYFRLGNKVEYEILSTSNEQDFVIDAFGTYVDPTEYVDVGDIL